MRWLTLCVVLAGCATKTTTAPPPAPPRKPSEPSVTERACLAALDETNERFAAPELVRCEHDLDCRAVAPLVSGRCNVFANAAAFEAQREAIRAQVATCEPVVQVVPRCPRLRPTCQSGRCAGEPISELPDECTELTESLLTDAKKGNACQLDEECTVLGGTPTSVAFVSASLERREHLARACGTVPPPLFAVKEATEEAFCVAGRCVSERASPQFTTVVRGKRQLVPPELDHECIKDRFLATFRDPREFYVRPREWVLVYVANLDTEGRQNQFEFVVPSGLSVEAQHAFASRLSECRAKQPARYRGKPIAIRERFTIHWINVE